MTSAIRPPLYALAQPYESCWHRVVYGADSALCGFAPRRGWYLVGQGTQGFTAHHGLCLKCARRADSGGESSDNKSVERV